MPEEHDSTDEPEEVSASEDTSEPTNAAEIDGLDEAVDPVDQPEHDQMGTGLFVLIAISLAAIVGAGVYVAGQVNKASSDAADAEARSDQILDDTDIDIGEFVDPNPGSLPLTESTTTTEPESSSTEAPGTTEPDDDRVIQGDGLHPEVDLELASIVVSFVNRAPGDDYGKIGTINFDGERIITELRCDRIDANAFGGICLKGPDRFTLSGYGLLLDTRLVPHLKFQVNDPSRAVISPEGSIVGWTGFTGGTTYGDFGDFSTISQLISVDRQRAVNMRNDFRTLVNGEGIDTPERNYWGATFADESLFYATMQSAEGTWIVEGEVATSRIETKFENASCPEVSHDGSTIVAKEQQDDGSYQLISIDVATGNRQTLGETRSVDDQVEWLDDDTILYALPNEEEGTAAEPAFDVWALDVAPGSTPQLLIPFADSPAAL